MKIHLPSGEVSTLSDAIALCPYLLDFNLPYFDATVRQLIALDPALNDLHFLLTRRVNELPNYDANKLSKLIVLLLGDEWCRVPSYATKVLAVFKCYGTRPKLTLHRQAYYLNAVTLLQYLRVFCKDLRRWDMRRKNVFPLPLGYFRQADLPIKEILDRSCDVSFVGSIQNLPDNRLSRGIKTLLRSPKILSRLSMVSQVSQWQSLGDYNIDVRLTSRFPHAKQSSELSDYSQRMMNTKICLSPRGTSFETFRYFEALRYGCVLISEPVPDHWFYRDSPSIYLNDWRQLPVLLEDLLSSPERLRALHRKALHWWETKCSPAALSARIYQDIRSVHPALCVDLEDSLG